MLAAAAPHPITVALIAASSTLQLLFFLMMDLGRLHSYYSYSLAAFVTVFNRAIDSVSGERDPARLAAAAAAAEVAALEDGAVAPGADDADGVVPAVAEAAATAAGVDTGASAPAPTGETAATSPASAPVRVLTDEQLVARCALLRETATAVTFAFVQRGLFEKDRLTVAAHLACKLLVDAGELPELLVRALVVGPPPSPGGADPGPLPPALAEWMPEGVWARARALEGVRPAFERLTEDVAAASPAWRAWFDAEKPEALPLPGEYAGLGTVSIHGLLLLRALRPDRLSAGLRAFIAARLGDAYVGGPPFSMGATYAESTASTPIFFVLFPGVDPTTWVEELGRARGITPESGRLVNISMGQGQEARAVRALTQLAATGGWVLLQNVHLMTTWLPSLERQLELLQESAHPDFRVFISAEPPPLAHMRNVPESLLQSCIKVANEAPAGGCCCGKRGRRGRAPCRSHPHASAHQRLARPHHQHSPHAAQTCCPTCRARGRASPRSASPRARSQACSRRASSRSASTTRWCWAAGALGSRAGRASTRSTTATCWCVAEGVRGGGVCESGSWSS